MNRREWIKRTLRLAALFGTGAIGGGLGSRSLRAGSAYGSCTAAGQCGSCPVLNDCGLPRGMSAREHLGGRTEKDHGGQRR